MSTNHSYNWPSLTPSLIFIFICLFFSVSCTDSQQGNDHSSTAETSKTNEHMIYKLYKSKSAGLINDQKMMEYIDAFGKIYSENDITVVGTWYDADDPSETYLITAFKSEKHYASFVEKMKSNDDYQRLSKEMEPDRVSIEAKTLKDYSKN